MNALAAAAAATAAISPLVIESSFSSTASSSARSSSTAGLSSSSAGTTSAAGASSSAGTSSSFSTATSTSSSTTGTVTLAAAGDAAGGAGVDNDDLPALPVEVGNFNIDIQLEVRDFTTQKNGPSPVEFAAIVTTVPAFKELVCNEGKCHIVCGVRALGNDTYEWGRRAAVLTPRDFNDFFLFKYQNNAAVKLNDIDFATLTKWNNRAVVVVVAKYSNVVSSKAIFARIQKVLVNPLQVDRAGAATEQAHAALVVELKALHSTHYAAYEASWGQFANYIMTLPAHLQEQAKAHAPPPNDGPNRINIQANRVALSVNSRVSEQLENILAGMKRTRDSLEADIHSIEAAIVVNTAQRQVLADQSVALDPQENRHAREIYGLIGSQDDVDHALV
ncbi:hypothetical protein HDU98_008711 [Podochytrium sp. JEL0797]|nr:hypothetical protein HDU98_008711 [Podochytrium sp. JEL0797]